MNRRRHGRHRRNPGREPSPRENFPDAPDYLDCPPWRQKAIAMVREHISFGRDGGMSRDSVWENLVDTLQETGHLEWHSVVEWYFDVAWPSGWKSRRRNPGRRVTQRSRYGRHRRRNSPYGATAGEYRHAGWNPRRSRRNPQAFNYRNAGAAKHEIKYLAHEYGKASVSYESVKKGVPGLTKQEYEAGLLDARSEGFIAWNPGRRKRSAHRIVVPRHMNLSGERLRSWWKFQHRHLRGRGRARRRANPLLCSMSREEMFHELKHHGSRPRKHKQRVAIVLDVERRCGRRNPARRASPRRGGRSGQHRVRNRSGAGAILLGHLTELVLADGRRITPSRLRGQYLAWIPGSNDFATVTKTSHRPGAVTREALVRHRKFHGADATKLAVFDWPDRVGALKPVGLLKSLTYVIPQGVNSPQKAGIQWYHLFGDHGEEGHGPVRGEKRYPPKLMPMMCQDAAGHLTIKRRPGNNYRVTDWIFW